MTTTCLCIGSRRHVVGSIEWWKSPVVITTTAWRRHRAQTPSITQGQGRGVHNGWGSLPGWPRSSPSGDAHPPPHTQPKHHTRTPILLLLPKPNHSIHPHGSHSMSSRLLHRASILAPMLASHTSPHYAGEPSLTFRLSSNSSAGFDAFRELEMKLAKKKVASPYLFNVLPL